jgi:hypothetical protein
MEHAPPIWFEMAWRLSAALNTQGFGVLVAQAGARRMEPFLPFGVGRAFEKWSE